MITINLMMYVSVISDYYCTYCVFVLLCMYGLLLTIVNSRGRILVLNSLLFMIIILHYCACSVELCRLIEKRLQRAEKLAAAIPSHSGCEAEEL